MSNDIASEHISLASIEKKMREEEFDCKFIDELISVFQQHNSEKNQEEFQKRMSTLHYRLPEEFQDQEYCLNVYEASKQWIENEVTKLENETKLSWEIQTEDIQDLDGKIRKTQLVIRHRLSEIVYDLID